MGLMMLGGQETQTAEPLVSEPSAFEVEKSPGIDQNPAEFITTSGKVKVK
jgi:hypothetical protein